MPLHGQAWPDGPEIGIVPLTPFSKTRARILKKAEFVDLRLHDLRHNFGSVSASLNMSLPMIAKMLGHFQTATTDRGGSS